ncbi:solute carrier family 22 member 7-like [Dermacentor albipictus]|uniref:solute carrier family 22 member 7-like n=1 Tax=Dermacentor albipictus TaxID=60249 RepID=UPI0038FD0235
MDLLFPQRLSSCDLRTSESFDCQEGFGYGAFQKRLFVLLLLAALSLNCQTTVLPIILGDVDHWCKRPENLNISAADWKNSAIPLEADGKPSHCHVYERCMPPADQDVSTRQWVDSAAQGQTNWYYNECVINNRAPETSNDTREMSCEEWDYDNRTAKTTAVSTWNLVCHRRLRLAAISALQNAGSVLFLGPFGAFADSLSRKTTLLASAAALVATTLCTFLATNYHLYTLARFLVGGSVGLNDVFSIVVPFEVTTHAHRPLQVLFWTALGILLGDVWFIVVQRVSVDWSLKQIIFLAPAALLLPASFIAPESPRWLVARGRLEEAEAVMMQAAETNNFPIADTAALMDKLKEEIEARKAPQAANEEELLDSYSLRRRALAMFTAYFAMTFSYYVANYSSAPMEDAWIPYVKVAVTVVAYGMMHVLVTGVALVTVLSACFGVTGVMYCLLTVAAAAGLGTVESLLLVLCRGTSIVIILHCFVYLLELFPSAVRCGAMCWMFACGRVGATFASVTFVLNLAGHEDVAFGLAATLLFASLLVIRTLPRTTLIERAKEESPGDANCHRKSYVGHMMRTLDQQTVHKTGEGSKIRKSTGGSAERTAKTAGGRHGHIQGVTHARSSPIPPEQSVQRRHSPKSAQK